MMRISALPGELADHYDVVVVGSGYGGGVAALRFSEAGYRVAVLERGRELRAQDLPATLAEVVADTHVRGRVGARDFEAGRSSKLFDVRSFDQLTAVVGSGLGGTSLINANVFLEPPCSVFDDPRWPRALRTDVDGRARGLARARSVLQPAPWSGTSHKAEQLRRAAGAIGGTYTRLPLMIEQAGARSCTGCGDCVTGCRVGAKRSVDQTYLRQAAARGAELFTEIEVVDLAQAPSGWRVRFRSQAPALDDETPLGFVLADRVVLAAGVFGSTEILLRSRASGLSLSPALGSQFSGNQNRLALVVGAGRPPDAPAADGPCIVGVVSTDDAARVEDGAIPSPLEPVVTGLMARRELLRKESPGLLTTWAKRARNLTALGIELLVGARQDVQVLLGQGRDGATGLLGMNDDGELMLTLEPQSSGPVARCVADVAHALGGELEDASELLPSGSSLTVHPLGGCPMGDDRDVGVVDDCGRVFDAGASDPCAVHPGLFVLDASIVPTAIGANPVATICLLAERACAALARPVETPRAPRPMRTRPQALGASFSERFRGWVTEPANASGEPAPETAAITLDLAIFVDSVHELWLDPRHAGRAIGVLTAPSMAPHAISILRGAVELFSDDPLESDVYHLRYELPLLTADGRRGHLAALKTFRDGGLERVYRDGTTLPFRIEGLGSTRHGLLTMAAADIAATIARVRVHGNGTLRERTEALARFNGFFARRWLERLKRPEHEAPT